MSESEKITTPDILADKYTFLQLIGEGSSGKTYLAEQKNSGCYVAVKILKFSLMENFKSYELFKREAEVLKSIQVPGVPRVFECVISDNADEISYIVQEYIDCPSLSQILKERKKLSEAQVLAILSKLAEIILALQTNYAPPIIHRDIKPSNILCDMNNEEYSVALIDFGAVANPQKKSSGSTIAGTFGYMAPEQMLNDVTIQSDYYAIGATALHLLTGKMPFEMESSQNAFELDYESAIQADAPETSPQMRALLAHLLETNFNRRPANAFVLKNEIETVRRGKMPVVFQNDERVSLLTKIRRWFKFHKLRPKVVVITVQQFNHWSHTKGLIRAFLVDEVEYQDNNDSKVVQFAEYTFDANNRTWCGRFPLNDYNLLKLKLPIPCEIRYDPDNPRFNELVFTK